MKTDYKQLFSGVISVKGPVGPGVNCGGLVHPAFVKDLGKAAGWGCGRGWGSSQGSCRHAVTGFSLTGRHPRSRSSFNAFGAPSAGRGVGFTLGLSAHPSCISSHRTRSCYSN